VTKPQNDPARQGRIGVRREGALGWIVIDNETRMNALGRSMWEALPQAVAGLESDREIRVVILRGAGAQAFSAGADISEFADQRTGAAAKAYDELNQAAFDAVTRCTKPTIAMISGFCMGGGFELALCCDLRLAAEGAQFAIPAARLGVGYNPRWFAPLLAVVSAARLKDLIYTGRRVGHEEAHAGGLLNEVCPGGELEARARALGLEIAANAPLSILAAKRAIDAHSRALTDEELTALDELVEACFDSADYAEGQAAFAAKRAPRFKGE